jgi:hypothetical protein
MPAFSDGQKISEAQWDRLIGSVPADYVIFLQGDIYYAECLVPDGTDYSGATKATIQQNAVDALATGGTIYLKEITLDGAVTYGNTILIIEDYQGIRKIYSNQGRHRACPLLSADPDTTGWGTSQKGYWWFNTASNVYKFWDGSAVITFESSAGAGIHAILSATHSDALAASVVRGDILVGNAAPKWSRLAKGAANTVLKSDGTDVSWANVAHTELTGVTTDQHHAQLHKATHARSGGDPLTRAGVIVDPSGYGDYTTIQAAIDSLS